MSDTVKWNTAAGSGGDYIPVIGDIPVSVVSGEVYVKAHIRPEQYDDLIARLARIEALLLQLTSQKD